MTAIDSRVLVPSAAELAAAMAAFDADWGAVDEVLYRACRDHPDHTSRRSITAKVALIGRTYSAGLERRVSPPPGQQAITVIGDYMLEHGKELDALIRGLRRLREPLTPETMRLITQCHGQFTRVMQGVATDGKAPRSFVAKYLHFHHPVVPLYDSYVVARITKRVRWDRAIVPFECPPEADTEYYAFCVRFFRLYDACLQEELDVTVRGLDAYLWQVPVGPAQSTGEVT